MNTVVVLEKQIQPLPKKQNLETKKSKMVSITFRISENDYLNFKRKLLESYPPSSMQEQLNALVKRYISSY